MAPLPGIDFGCRRSGLPECLADLESCGVCFTGDKDTVTSLVEHDTVGGSARLAWECLLTLEDYVRARRAGDWDQGLASYLKSPPPGYRAVPPKKFAAGESKSTMAAWGEQRRFPVPPSVDPSGSALMEAHFKLGHIGLVSPRLYVLDNYSSDGRVYVGYIGRHLRTTQTN